MSHENIIKKKASSGISGYIGMVYTPIYGTEMLDSVVYRCTECW